MDGIRVYYEVPDGLAEDLKNLKVDEIVRRGEKEWDKGGEGEYRKWINGYFWDSWWEMIRWN